MGLKAEKIAPGRGRTIKVALVRLAADSPYLAAAGGVDLYRVYVLRSNYSAGRDVQRWFVENSSYRGLPLAEAEALFSRRSAPQAVAA